MNDSNYFLGYWSSEGFESITDITKYNKQEQYDLLSILKEEPLKPSELDYMLYSMKLRARMNHHRNYELYAMKTDKDIDLDTLNAIADSSPQEAANLFREYGVPIIKKATERHKVIS